MPALTDHLAPYRVTEVRPTQPRGLWSALAGGQEPSTGPTAVADDTGTGREGAARRAILAHLAGLAAAEPCGAEVIPLDAYRLRRAV